MQNRYVGDVGDFGKYGLLRCLAQDLRLGVVWYLTPGECCRNDGKHVDYLQKPDQFRDCDPDLSNRLKAIVESEHRCVHRVQTEGVLSAGTAVYHELLHFPPHLLRPARKDWGRLWLAGALQAPAVGGQPAQDGPEQQESA